jgi:hypothetical protein
MTLRFRISRRSFPFSLRTLLLLFVPVALLAGLASWLFRPPPIDLAITVERFYWFKDTLGNGVGLGAEVRITNKSKDTVWYMENPRYCLLQCVDGSWLTSSRGMSLPRAPGEVERDWWSPQDGMQTKTISVGPISEKATAIQVMIPLTTDRLMPRRHWVSSPEVRITKKGNDYVLEARGTSCAESLDAPMAITRGLKRRIEEERKKGTP